MIEFMGITPKDEDLRSAAEYLQTSLEAKAARVEKSKPDRPDYEPIYNEAMQRIRQLEELLDDAGFIIAAYQELRQAERDIGAAKASISQAAVRQERAEAELDKYRDSLEALRGRTELPFG